MFMPWYLVRARQTARMSRYAVHGRIADRHRFRTYATKDRELFEELVALTNQAIEWLMPRIAATRTSNDVLLRHMKGKK
jgi:hypothetical protein